MSGTKSTRVSAKNGFIVRQTEAQELATFRQLALELQQDPQQARAVAVKAGIMTPKGRLTKRYGG